MEEPCFTIFYLICALLYCWRNFKSVFGSEDFVTIAKKSPKSNAFKKTRENTRKNIGQYMSKSKTLIYTLIIRRWPHLWIFNGVLAAKNYQCLKLLNPKRSFASTWCKPFGKACHKVKVCLWKDWAATILMFWWRHRKQKLPLFVQWQKIRQLSSVSHFFATLFSRYVIVRYMSKPKTQRCGAGMMHF